MESDKINTKSSYVESIPNIKLEPDNFHDSMVDVSEQTENTCNSSESSQNVHKFPENVLGNYYYKN